MKKRYLLLFVSLFAIAAVQAQNMAIYSTYDTTDISGTTITVTGNYADTDVAAYALFKQESGSTIEVTMYRTEDDVEPNGLNGYCWGICPANQPAGTNPTLQMIPAGILNCTSGQYYDNFVSHHDPNGHGGLSKYTFVWYDRADATDSAFVRINVDVTPATSIEEEEDKLAQVRVFPNPATAIVNFEYDFGTGFTTKRIDMINMVGAKVASIPMNGLVGSTKFDTSTLPSGIYFYALVADDRTISTNRLVVTH